jgi:hypothetical protein
MLPGAGLNAKVPSDLGGWEFSALPSTRSRGHFAGAIVACGLKDSVARADSIKDVNLLRHGAVATLFGGIRAPSTLGSFLRALDWGNVRQAGQGPPAAPRDAGGRLLRRQLPILLARGHITVAVLRELPAAVLMWAARARHGDLEVGAGAGSGVNPDRAAGFRDPAADGFL